MKIKLFIFVALFGVLFMMQACDKDEDIVFPEYPQEKLQFNKVFYETLSGSTSLGNSDYVDSLVLTISTNKVVKIESIGSGLTAHNGVASNGPAQGHELKVTLDGAIIYSHLNGSEWNFFPIWLPQGTHVIKMWVQGYQNDTYTYTAIISGIEYDIAP